MCNGNLGHVIIQPDELAEIRKNKAVKGGKLAGIKLIDVIREPQPDFARNYNFKAGVGEYIIKEAKDLHKDLI